MRSTLSYGGLLVSFSCLVIAQSYNWPCTPFDQQHWVNGTFCECRSGSSSDIDHFHDGIDIHLSEGGAVYSVINGTVTSIGTASQYGINSWVRVGRYAYVHVNHNPSLSVNDPVTAFQTVLGWTNSWNHIHFKDGYPGSEINPIRLNGGLDPLIDQHSPTVHNIKFYLNGTQMEFQNDQVYGQVDIVSRAWDRTDTGPLGSNNGIYKIGFEILDAEGSIFAGPHIPFVFNTVPASDNYVDNVYFDGSNTSTYYYIVTNNLTSDAYLNVSTWPVGLYTARIMTWDQYLNSDTLEQIFEVVGLDTTPPAPPILLSILPEGNGFKLRWLANSEDDIAGYRLYFSYDFENWNSNHNEATLTNTVTELVAPSFSTELAYFRLTAVDNAPFPNESEPSEIYTIRRDPDLSAFLLFFDAYSTAGQVSPIPFIGQLGEKVNAFDYITFGTINHRIFELDSTFNLYAFDGEQDIIIHTGQSNQPLSDNMIAELELRLPRMNYNTWLIGTNSLEAFSATPTGQNFLNQNEIAVDTIIPIPDSVVGFPGSIFYDFTADLIPGLSDWDSLNTISLSLESNAYPNLSDGSGKIIGFELNQLANFYYSAIPIELYEESDREDMLDRMLGFLISNYNSIDDQALLPAKLQLTCYPNPFNSQGRFILSGTTGDVEVTLITLLGQTVWKQKIRLNSQGIDFMLPSNVLNSMASGVYFIRAVNSGSPLTRLSTTKILYLK